MFKGLTATSLTPPFTPASPLPGPVVPTSVPPAAPSSQLPPPAQPGSPVADEARIGVLLDMLRNVSTATTSAQAFLAFISQFWRLKPVDFFLGVNTDKLPAGSYQLTYRIPVSVLATGDLSRVSDLRPRDLAALPIHTGGFIGSVIAGNRPRLLSNLDLSRDPVLAQQLGSMRCAVAIPVFAQGQLGEWAFAFAEEPAAFSSIDLEQALVTANLLATHNDHLDLMHTVRRLNSRLTTQMQEITRIQASLLPRRTPNIPRLRIATSYLTSDEVGGDYYDFFPLDRGRHGLLIADVSGHGAGAATVMAMLRTMLHAHHDLSQGPAAILHYANHRLVDSGMDGSFVTAFFGIFDPGARSLTWSRAGHPHPRIKAGPGTLLTLDGHGSPPLGITRQFDVREQTTRLETGSTVIMYTDGITEAFNHRRQMFGEEGLDRALASAASDPDQVVDTVHAALYAHTGRHTRQDDQTLVVFKVLDDHDTAAI